MSSIVRETLYAVSGRTEIEIVELGEARSRTSCLVPETHDANDATYDKGGMGGDGSDPGGGWVGVRWTITTAAYSGPVDKVRVRVRAKETHNLAPTEASLYAYYNSSEQGTKQALAGSFGWHEFDFTEKPGGGAWTAAAINALSWGWVAFLSAFDESSYADVTVPEFEVQVYGSTTLASEHTIVAAMEVGAVYNSLTIASEHAIEAVMESGTSTPGTRVLEATSHDAYVLVETGDFSGPPVVRKDIFYVASDANEHEWISPARPWNGEAAIQWDKFIAYGNYTGRISFIRFIMIPPEPSEELGTVQEVLPVIAHFAGSGSPIPIPEEDPPFVDLYCDEAGQKWTVTKLYNMSFGYWLHTVGGDSNAPNALSINPADFTIEIWGPTIPANIQGSVGGAAHNLGISRVRVVDSSGNTPKTGYKVKLVPKPDEGNVTLLYHLE